MSGSRVPNDGNGLHEVIKYAKVQKKPDAVSIASRVQTIVVDFLWL